MERRGWGDDLSGPHQHGSRHAVERRWRRWRRRLVGGSGSIVQENWTGGGGDDSYTEKPLVWKAEG